MKPEELHEMKKDVELLKSSMERFINAVTETSKLQEALTKSLHELTVEIREDRARREARDEARTVQDAYVQSQITQVKENTEHFNKKYQKPLERLIVNQSRWDTFISGITSKLGQIILVVIIVALLLALGVDPNTFKISS